VQPPPETPGTYSRSHPMASGRGMHRWLTLSPSSFSHSAAHLLVLPRWVGGHGGVDGLVWAVGLHASACMRGPSCPRCGCVLCSMMELHGCSEGRRKVKSTEPPTPHAMQGHASNLSVHARDHENETMSNWGCSGYGVPTPPTVGHHRLEEKMMLLCVAFLRACSSRKVKCRTD